MKKRNIIIVISVISLALLGLMAIQVHWIRNAITVKEAGFVRGVNEAVSEVVFRLEKIDMQNMLRQRIKKGSPAYSYMRSFDSLNLQFYQELSQIQSREDFEQFINKTFLTQGLIQEWLDPFQRKPIDERIEYGYLDSALNAELERRGIDTEYEFGIYNPARNKMIYQKSGKYPTELLEKSFVFTLFPSEIQNDPNYLMIYFPREKRFLLSQLWGLLGISIILILLIIFAFTYSINTILKQKKLSEMKNDFINNMTHEFKTPISTISLACEALNDKDIQKSEEVYDSYISVIRDENKRLGGMAEKVLQSAIIEKGQLNLKKEWVNVHEIINNVIDKFKLQVEKRNGKIETDLKADASTIHADRMHLTNMVFNLIDNANKYTLDEPHIKISTINIDSGISIAVKDNGIGISKSDQKRIFEKLYRIPTGNIHNFKGFGLGLNYVKAIVDKHGGKIELDSEPRKGSEFFIYLPLEQY